MNEMARITKIEIIVILYTKIQVRNDRNMQKKKKN